MIGAARRLASVFAGRAREDGSYYVTDLTLEELRRLHVSEGAHLQGGSRVANYPPRFPVDQAPVPWRLFFREAAG